METKILSQADNAIAADLLLRMRRSFGYAETDKAITHMRNIHRMMTYEP